LNSLSSFELYYKNAAVIVFIVLYTHHNRRKEKRPRTRICAIIIYNIIYYIILYELGTATNILRRQFIPGAIPFRGGGGSLYIICITAAAGGKRDLARDALVLRPCTNQYVRERMRFYHDIIIIIIIILRIFGRR